MTLRKNFLSGVLLCGCAVSLQTAAFEAEDLSIHGFASIIGSKSLEGGEQRYGIDHDLSFQEESKFALRISAPIAEKFTATAQLIAKGSNDFETEFEWAYLSYQYSDNLTFLAGRQRFKLYKYSDIVNVGYGYHWIRPPQGVYAVPFNSGNGLGLLYNHSFDDVDMKFTYKYLGEEISEISFLQAAPSRLDIGMTHMINVDFTQDDFNYGINLVHLPEMTFDSEEFDKLQGLLANPAAVGLPSAPLSEAEIARVMSQVRASDETLTFYGGYLGYDPGDWFVMAEYNQYEFNNGNAFSDQKSFYLSAGMRVDSYTFHATYGNDYNGASSSIYETVADPYLQKFVKDAVSTQLENSDAYSIGARWDYEVGIALKAEFTRYNDKYNIDDADLISFGVDYVF